MPSVEGQKGHKERFEALTDPEKIDIHFRAMRVKILRSLGTASYRNGSQFVMLWVNPTGQVADAYASEALLPKLEEWLGKRIKGEAMELVKAWKAEKERRKIMGEERIEVEGVYRTEGDMFHPDPIDEQMSDGEGQDLQTKIPRTTKAQGGATLTRTGGIAQGLSIADSLPSSSSTKLGHRSTRSTDSKLHQHPSPALSSSNSVTSPTLQSSSLSPDGQDPYKMTREELEKWFTTRLCDLSHKTDKIVCRSWIKAIEPLKQNNYPYQKGEVTKPDWWPSEIRHKEPDHLGKHERVGLLLHLLRLPQVSLVELEASTAANHAQIPAHKLPILQRIYEYAKAERRINVNPYSGKYEGLLPKSALPERATDDDLQALPAPTETRGNRPQRRAKNTIGSPNAVDLSMTQQTPRTARASPYPLARSASASHELSNLSLNSATSPSLAHSPASTSLSRSQSHAGLNASSSTGRAPRLNGRASVGEGDLQATPYQGGRVRTTITPRGGAASQGSPLSASMGRSASTSAIGAKTMMDDSVASPAMIKSRSKLSQKCFEQMGAGPVEGGGGVGGRSDFAGQPTDYGQFPQPQFTMIHPHHLQSMRPHPEGFPPPLPVVPGQHHLVGRHPAQNSLPHPHHPQVQVQVQVNAGHGLPIPPQSHHPSFAFNHQQQFSNSPIPQSSSHFSSPNPQQSQQQQQGQMHFVAPNGLVYEHGLPQQIAPGDEAAFFAATGGTPLSGFINSPDLAQQPFGVGIEEGREYLMVPGNHENPAGGGGGSSDGFDANAYLNPAQFNPGNPEPDLGAYVRQLEGFERQQSHQGGGYEVGLGFEGSNGHPDLGTYTGNEEFYF
ncbi:hypothetical protein JCM3765_001336 [Sporobolomyces pararoseus]